jgi:hypothetical protein
MKAFPACALGALLALASALPQAGPAPWFKWRSKVDGALACAQTALGPGWEKADGPYRNSHCEKVIIAK